MVNKYITIKNKFNFINFSPPLGDFKSRPEWKTFLDFCGDLGIRQFASILHTNDMTCKVPTLKVFLKLELRLLWAENLNLGGILNVRDDLVIIFVEMIPETPVAYILW